MKTERIVFEKTGNARYISHLDLVRSMTRAVRRAALPVWYTEGFNRHPYLTFAAPLSLGYEGLRETMDFRLEEELTDEEVVHRFNAVLPDGLRVTEAAEAVRGAGDVAFSRYRLTLACPTERVQALLAQPSILVEKRTKKGEMKTVDLRPCITDSVCRAENGGTVWEITLPSGSNGSVNPSLVLSALADGEALPCQITRLAVLCADGKEFR